ncbi:hypothetical protein N1F89_13120 [Aquibium sp. A9E412]|uniref:hypothetical protein n=1 Tax=Aquibium sp. A9E412 TaxID=2976767 RepID=UPI0025B2201E|nr:hypothetical protein [Aquibium sp. A9E412]MDN2567163.1 hypothetical protein [Aquibium sp. A9E412]
MDHGQNDIDRLIREEMRLVAAEHQGEAWAEGFASGIAADIMAEAALSTAFRELQRSHGEEAALALIERMRERVIAGEFIDSARH